MTGHVLTLARFPQMLTALTKYFSGCIPQSTKTPQSLSGLTAALVQALPSQTFFLVDR